MAEIKIEKKKPIWPWIILVLVILAILYFLVFANDDDDDIEDVNTEQIEEETVWEEEADTSWEEETGAVAGYLSYVADESRMGIDHEYTNNALIELMNAVQAKADDMNYDISADMEKVRQQALKIQQDPTALTHANTIKDAGMQLVNILQNMQEEAFPQLSSDVQEVKTAASNIDGSVQTFNQKDQVNKFFSEAADVLRKMS